MIVNDDAGERLALETVLQPLGYAVVQAGSGLAALRCVMKQDFAVILLDVCMPDMDGFETAGLLRQRRQSEMTPIIFVTSYGSDEIPYTDLYSQGAVDFLFAPVAPDELRAKVTVFANIFVNARQLAIRARAVQTSADHLRLLTEAAPIGIFRTDAENRYAYTNPRWSEITGIPAAVALGQRWGSIIGAEHRASSVSDPADPDAYPGELSHRFEIQLPDSSTRTVLVTSKSIPERDGGTAGWVGTIADISAEVGAEAAMAEARDRANEASRLKSDFLANMSHEIRTPMNGVIGMTDLLLETDLDPRQHDYAQTVRNSGEALLAIINDILDFSKVEAGQLEIEDIEFDVQTIVDHVADLLAGPAQTKGLELVAVVERSVPALVNGDPGRVRQVLTNFVGNAIKFTQIGEIVVRVTAMEAGDGDSTVRFEVSDTGDGIAPDKVALVFEPFVQADTSTSRRYGGTGLGLAISRDLVELMGGECEVSSSLGDGSIFSFTIRVHTDADAGVHRHGRSPDADLVGVRALVVDDNGTCSRVLSEYLTDWGMTVTTTESGAGALTEIRAALERDQPFAVAVVDQSMPGMDGLALKNTIVSEPALETALVLLVGLGQDRELGPAGESGFRACVSKPVHLEDLRSAVRIGLGLEIAPDGVSESTHVTTADDPQVGRLLLAEDNRINQKVAVAMLHSAGYLVDIVPTGAAAVQAAATHAYDAILMDCQMPEMNGYEATTAIRAQEGAGRHTPIIAMTAGARREDRDRCRASGMDSYLAKPVNKDALLALVARSVKNGRALATAMSGANRPSAEEITIDLLVFDRLRVLGAAAGHDLLTELIEQFVHDTAPLLVQLREALEARDAIAIARIAHMIKGSSGQLGGRRLAASCDRMERNAATASLTDGASDLRDIEVGYALLQRAWATQIASDQHEPRKLHA